MRASGRFRRKDYKKSLEVHISGAEGIYERDSIAEAVEGYIKRAMSHPRGKPDRIEITIERINARPKKIRSLPIKTVICRSTQIAQSHIRKILVLAGVTDAAIDEALKVVYGEEAMRGAAIICAGSGRRVEPDRERGIRASRLGMSKAAGCILSRELTGGGINSETVKEALVLASKVASCEQVIGELCVSDDPGYTTGYVSSRRVGYVRIPHIKRKGDRRGGRVFFMKDDADLAGVIAFLEETPVLVDGASECLGVFAIDEVLGHRHI
jgi:6-carboxyhexanoate--CoA ligase